MSGSLRDLIRQEAANSSKLAGVPVFYNPSSLGGSDDAANINGMLIELAGLQPLVLRGNGNPFAVKTTVQIPGHSVFDLGGADIASTVSGSFPLTGSVFRAGPGGATGAATTLSSSPSPGSMTIQVTNASEAVVGGFAYLNNTTAARRFYYRIERINGTTLTLERPLPLINNFASGDAVTFFGPTALAEHVYLLGNGATIHGTSVVAVSLQGARFSLVENIRFNLSSATSPSDAYGVFNNGCYRCIARGLDADGYDATAHAAAGAPSVALAMESADECVFVDMTARQIGNHGFGFVECHRCIMKRVHASGCGGLGLQVANDTVTTHGSDYCVVADASFNNNVGGGLIVYFGSSHTTLMNVETHNNAGAGITVGDGVTPSFGTTLINCKSRYNTLNGLKIAAGSKGTRLFGVDLSENTSADLNALDEFSANGLYTQNSSTNAGQLWWFAAAVEFHITNFKIEHGASIGAVGCVYNTAGSRVHMSHGVVTLGKNADAGFWIPSGAGLFSLDHVQVKPLNGGITGTFGALTQAGTIRLGDGVDLDGTANPFSIAGGGVFSLGVVTANGSTPVDVTWPDLKSTDHVGLTRKADNGTPGPTPRVAKVPGTKFTVIAAGEDLSDYEYEVRGG